MTTGEEREKESFKRLKGLYKHVLDSPKCSALDPPRGLRKEITLYRFQRQSLARMLEREEKPELYEDPFFEKITKNGEIIYKKQGRGETFSTKHEPSRITDEKGGILCEDMGTGKTAICLSLILATKGRKGTPCNPYIELPSITRDHNNKLMSLKEMCGHRVNEMWDPKTKDLPLDVTEYLDSLYPPHFIYQAPSSSFRYSPPPSEVFISHATLVIVPATLINQWLQEIQKFIEDGFLDVLVIKEKKDLFRFNEEPITPQRLAKCDIVLTTHSFLQHEKTGLEYFSTNNKKISIFMLVYWFRVIVDEGHVMGREKSNQTYIASNLFADRLWCCSGTPTPDSNVDNELRHLHGLIKFLKQKPFNVDKHWSQLVFRPFKKGKNVGVDNLARILQRIMVRHREEDIEKDVVLPKLHQKVTKLHLSLREALRYNQLVGVAKTNLISSRFEGPQSLLNTSNRVYAYQLLARLREGCFYYDGIVAEEVNNCLETITDDLYVSTEKKKIFLTEDQKETLRKVSRIMKVNALAEKDEFNTKLNYLLNTIESLPKDSKCIVFSQVGDTLRRILDYLDSNSSIKFTEFHSDNNPTLNSSNVITFNTSSDVNIIVMDVNKAAWGINMIAANYIFFMEPLDDRSKEAQAIKRAHRIGQHREVFVEKLVIEGSVEELMVKYVEENHNKKDGKKRTEDDKKMHHFLKNVEFLEAKCPQCGQEFCGTNYQYHSNICIKSIDPQQDFIELSSDLKNFIAKYSSTLRSISPKGNFMENSLKSASFQVILSLLRSDSYGERDLIKVFEYGLTWKSRDLIELSIQRLSYLVPTLSKSSNLAKCHDSTKELILGGILGNLTENSRVPIRVLIALFNLSLNEDIKFLRNVITPLITIDSILNICGKAFEEISLYEVQQYCIKSLCSNFGMDSESIRDHVDFQSLGETVQTMIIESIDRFLGKSKKKVERMETENYGVKMSPASPVEELLVRTHKTRSASKKRLRYSQAVENPPKDEFFQESKMDTSDDGFLFETHFEERLQPTEILEKELKRSHPDSYVEYRVTSGFSSCQMREYFCKGVAYASGKVLMRFNESDADPIFVKQKAASKALKELEIQKEAENSVEIVDSLPDTSIETEPIKEETETKKRKTVSFSLIES